MGRKVHPDEFLFLLEQEHLVFLSGERRHIRADRAELLAVSE